MTIDKETVLTFGFDAKIGPGKDGEIDNIIIVEANGVNSGMNGATMVYPDIMRKRMEAVLSGMGIGEQVPIMDIIRTVHISREEFLTGITEHGMLVANLTPMNQLSQRLQQILDDKIRQKDYIPQRHRVPFCVQKIIRYGREISVERLPWLPGNEDLVDPENFPFFVLKSPSGARGEEVIIDCSIFPCHDIQTILQLAIGDQEGRVLVEKYAPQIPVPHPETGLGHEACMRFLVDLLLIPGEKEPQILFETAYWRLSKKTLRRIYRYLIKAILSGNAKNARKWMDELKINLSRGAIPAPASEQDVSKVRPVVHQVIQNMIANHTE